MKYLVRKRALGDVLWIEPVVRQLAKRNKRIVVYTKFPELFQNFPFSYVRFQTEISLVGKVMVRLDKKIGTRFFSINLDDAYERRPNVHFLHAYQRAARLPETTEYPRIYLSQQEKNQKLVEGRYVLLHVESFSEKKFRQIFGVNWREVIAFFKQQGYQVIQVGVSAETLPGATVIKTTLRELIVLCSKASCFIGIDSGPSHIAASFGVPSIIFFGAVNPLNRHFLQLFRGILLKQPCEYDADQATVLKEKCLLCHRSADEQIALCSTYSTEAVLSAARQLMQDYDL